MKDITKSDLQNNLKLTAQRGGTKTFEDLHDLRATNCLLTIAGPCRVESYEQCYKIASFLKELGVRYFRAGAFKPCTFPHACTGLKYEGLDILDEIKDKLHLKIVTEVMDIRDIKRVSQTTDIFQIGARNMQNYNLLSEVAKLNMPVLLKRHPGSSLSDFLGAS